jgi:hypothetical protein
MPLIERSPKFSTFSNLALRMHRNDNTIPRFQIDRGGLWVGCGSMPRKRKGVTEGEARGALAELDPIWDELFPAEQARIV